MWRSWLAFLMAIAVIVTSCGSNDFEPRVAVDGVEAVTLAADAEGTLWWLDREGAVYRGVDSELYYEVDVTSEGQRGLLGLAHLDERVFIAYTDPSGQLLVEEITDPTSPRLVWNGVQTPGGGLGGRLGVFEGKLLIGFGNGADTEEFGQNGGAMMTIDPDDPEGQTPQLVSAGWDNPFGFAVTPSGHLWVADNDPSDGLEMLARGDDGDATIELPKATAPSGLAAVSDTELLLCSYTTNRLDRYRIDDDGIPERSGTLATDCVFDVLEMPDGVIAYSTATGINMIDRSS